MPLHFILKQHCMGEVKTGVKMLEENSGNTKINMEKKAVLSQ